MDLESSHATLGSYQLAFGSERLTLLPERAVWLEQHRALLVADIHFGKETVFRRHGIAVPDGSSTADLERLSQLCVSVGAADLWILGDLVHGALSETLRSMLQDWLATLAPVRVHLVEGNHERHAQGPLRSLLLDHHSEARLGPYRLRHEPASRSSAATTAAPEIVGHSHPVARLTIARHRALRIPAFAMSEHRLTIPAFGQFTGGHRVDINSSLQCYGILGNRVFPVPAS